MVFLEFTERYEQFVRKTSKAGLVFFLSIFLFSCNKKEEISHQRGEMTIWVDPTNKNLITALTEIYQMKYPEVQFNFIYEAENVILQNLLNLNAEAAFINKPLNEQQTKFIEQESTVTPRSTLLAYDAVVFITSKENTQEFVDMEDLKENILNPKSKFVFDNPNSGNFNTLIDILELDVPKGQSVASLESTDSLINFISQSRNSIGIIGLNVISEKENPKVKEILSKIKVLPIKNKQNKIFEPTLENVLEFKYPFFKGVYFIVREPGFGIGSGFTRFAGSQQGQLIVAREGLQPNFLYDRVVQIRDKPL